MFDFVCAHISCIEFFVDLACIECFFKLKFMKYFAIFQTFGEISLLLFKEKNFFIFLQRKNVPVSRHERNKIQSTPDCIKYLTVVNTVLHRKKSVNLTHTYLKNFE